MKGYTNILKSIIDSRHGTKQHVIQFKYTISLVEGSFFMWRNHKRKFQYVKITFLKIPFLQPDYGNFCFKKKMTFLDFLYLGIFFPNNDHAFASF